MNFASSITLLTSIGILCLRAAAQDVTPVPLTREIIQSCAGNYQLAGDRFVSIGPFSEVDGRPVFYDSKTRRFGVLYPLSEIEFVTGTLHANNAITPADLRVTFEPSKDGKIVAMNWREGDVNPIRAKRVSPHRDEEVVFQNGDVQLHGTLTLPATPGRHPVVIFLQEAGPRARPFGMWPYLFARYGIAMLTFDKRGSGDSTGNWETASFDDLAGDALSAIRLLLARDDVDPKQIGLWANSNSGWVVPIVATRSGDVAFIINRVGPAVKPTENILYEIESQMRAGGSSEPDIRKAVALRRELQEAIVSNEGWNQFRDDAARAQNEPWFGGARVARYASAHLPPDEPTRQQWRGSIDFDPIPFWEKVTCPVLTIYGELDPNTPTSRNEPLLRAALQRAGNKDFTITVLPKTNHLFYEFETTRQDYFAAIPAMQRLAPGYVDGMMSWLAERIRLPKTK